KKPWKYDVPPALKEESVMSNNSLMTDEQIFVGLKALRQAPELRPSEIGLEAKLRESWIKVDRVREVVFRKPQGEGVISFLQQNGVDLGWLMTPDPTIERADLPDDYYEWAEELGLIAERSWIAAETLYVEMLSLAAERRIFLPEEARQETVERVYRTLGG